MSGGNRQPHVIIGGMQKNQSVKTDGVCTCLTSSMGTGGGYVPMHNYTNDLRIRKLTPKECFRLMGFDDEDFEKCSCSNTQLYKQAGNSIVVDVVEEILCMLFDEDGNFLFRNYLNKIKRKVIKMEVDVIYNEDCLEGMKRIPDGSIDMILCDLPYGTTACKWDSVIPFEPLWEQYKRIIKDNGAIVLFGSEPFSSKLRYSNLKMYRYDWIWAKNRGTGIFNANKMPLKSHETISVFYKKLPQYNPQMREGKPYKCKQGKQSGAFGESNRTIITESKGGRYPLTVIEFNSTNGKNVHPTQKPVALLEYLIKTYTNEGDTVLDNCAGSGSTLVAAVNTNRHYIGFELDEHYFDIACQRLDEVE